MFKAKTIYKKSDQIHQNHTHDQWRSAARVSMSKCTNPCYMTHRVLKARMNYCINQNPGQNITSKPNTEAPQCHWLPATRFQRVQNPDPNKLHNASKSCSRQNTSTKIMLSRYLTIRRWEKKNSSKWIGWMEARWMGFSFGLNTHHSWYLPWHQKQALFLTWKRASDPRPPTVGHHFFETMCPTAFLAPTLIAKTCFICTQPKHAFFLAQLALQGHRANGKKPLPGRVPGPKKGTKMVPKSGSFQKEFFCSVAKKKSQKLDRALP